MKDDLLRQATQALRDTGQDEGVNVNASRARIMLGVHQARRRRGARLSFAIPLAAIFLGSTAWAAATGRLPQVWQAITELTTLNTPAPAPTSPAPAPRAPKAPARLRVAEVAPTPTPDPSAALVEEPAPEIRDAPLERPVRATTPTPAPAPKSTTAAPDPTDALFRTAHRVHFVERDSERALAAWEAYLKAAPRGRFQAEARYNRALCLLRLGRTAEAQTALRPFASGTYGSYRQNEARALIDATGADAAASP